MKRRTWVAFGTALGVASATLPATTAAANEIVYSAADQGIVVVGGIGYSWLEGNELVYDNFGNRISHLIWETQAPVLTLEANGRLGGGWTLAANASLGFSGSTHMVDYDWIGAYWQGFNFEDWTHRSLHPNTSLDRYLDFNVAAGHDFALSEATTINLHGGFKYSNIKWTSTGGTFVYSSTGYRANTGTFPDTPGITYEQRLPGLFLGLSGTSIHGNWTFSGHVRGGATIGATAIDHHWLRDLRFDEEYTPVPFVSLAAKADYSMSHTTSVYLGLDYDRYFHTKSDVRMYNIPTGAPVGGAMEKGGGLDFTAFKLHGGVKVSF